MTRCRLAGDTPGLSSSVRDTEDAETPARQATSNIVIRSAISRTSAVLFTVPTQPLPHCKRLHCPSLRSSTQSSGHKTEPGANVERQTGPNGAPAWL